MDVVIGMMMMMMPSMMSVVPAVDGRRVACIPKSYQVRL